MLLNKTEAQQLVRLHKQQSADRQADIEDILEFKTHAEKLDKIQKVLHTFIKSNWKYFEHHLKCQGNCDSCPDIQIVICYLNNKDQLAAFGEII